MYPVNPLLFRHGALLGNLILLLSAVDPLARAGMETPTGAHCLAKLATHTSPSTSPLYFSYFPLVSLYLLLFVFAPFPFLFLWGSSPAPPFLGMA